MKVPNKVLNAVVKLVANLPESEEKVIVMQWAHEGILKRSVSPITSAIATAAQVAASK